MKIQRREFLKRSAIGLGGMFIGARLGAAELAGQTPTTASSFPKYFDPFERVTLGKSGLKVSRLCMGTGTSGVQRQSNQTRLGRDNLNRLLRDALDRGVRTFDCADQYGSHPYLASAMKDVPREKYDIITKIRWHGGANEPDANVYVERFLKELSTDHIDLLLIHCVTSPEWPSEMRKQMEILSKYKEKGVIRALGVSCHSIAALEAAAADPWVDSVHTRINPYGMSMDGDPEQVIPVIKKIHAAGKGVVGMKIVGAGRLRADSDRRQESVKFALNLGCVDILNVGFESLDQIDGFADHIKKTTVKAA
jgi:aryl-alcohol dehydrogenase-like predicted oxidoreductase